MSAQRKPADAEPASPPLRILSDAPPPRPSRLYVLCIAAVMAAAGGMRAVRLEHPVRYDEAFTFLKYVAGPDWSDWLNYSTPNNHVLHTLLVRRSVLWTGSLAPWALRGPALIAGVLLVPLSAGLGRRLARRDWAGLLAGALVGAASLLVEYSINARGYSMVCLAGVGLVLCLERVMRNPASVGWWIGFAVIAALGALTIPVMVLPVGVCVAAYVVQAFLGPADRSARNGALLRLVGGVGLTGVLTALAYWPVVKLNGLDALLGNRFVQPQPFGEVLAGLGDVWSRTLADWTRDGAWAWGVAIAPGLVLAIAAGWQRRNVLLWLVPLGAGLVTAIALAQRVLPYPRVWMFLLPWALATAPAGWAWLDRRSGNDEHTPGWVGRAGVAAVVITAGLWVWQTHERTYLISEEPATLTDAGAIVSDARDDLADYDTALVSSRFGMWSLAYCVVQAGIEPVHYDATRSRQALVVVGPGEDLAEVLEQNPLLEFLYEKEGLWREYPRSRVYLYTRRGRTGDAPPATDR